MGHRAQGHPKRGPSRAAGRSSAEPLQIVAERPPRRFVECGSSGPPNAQNIPAGAGGCSTAGPTRSSRLGLALQEDALHNQTSQIASVKGKGRLASGLLLARRVVHRPHFADSAPLKNPLEWSAFRQRKSGGQTACKPTLEGRGLSEKKLMNNNVIKWRARRDSNS